MSEKVYPDFPAQKGHPPPSILIIFQFSDVAKLFNTLGSLNDRSATDHNHSEFKTLRLFDSQIFFLFIFGADEFFLCSLHALQRITFIVIF